MIQSLQDLGALISSQRPDCVLEYAVKFDELNIDVSPSNIVGFVDFLKSDRNCRFSTLVDITAVDYPGREKRFEVVYHLLRYVWHFILRTPRFASVAYGLRFSRSSATKRFPNNRIYRAAL